MKSGLAKWFLLRKYICIFLFCSFFSSIVAAEPDGFVYLKYLCFKNPGHKLVSGKWCGFNQSKKCYTKFRICIINQKIYNEIKKENCPVYYNQTESYYYAGVKCVKDETGMNIYRDSNIQAELHYPFQEAPFLRIVAWDHHNNEPVASFAAEFNHKISTNVSKLFFQNITMTRTDDVINNPGVSLDISMAVYKNPKLSPPITTQMTTQTTTKVTPRNPSVNWDNQALKSGLFFGILVIISIIVFIAWLIRNNVDEDYNGLLENIQEVKHYCNAQLCHSPAEEETIPKNPVERIST